MDVSRYTVSTVVVLTFLLTSCGVGAPNMPPLSEAGDADGPVNAVQTPPPESSQASGRECPSETTSGPAAMSLTRTLEGAVVFHDGIRKWFEIKLEAPTCGVNSIQLVDLQDQSKHLEIFRGCRVKSKGTLNYAGTGYFSLDIFQSVEAIDPDPACNRQSPFPDYTESKPERVVRAYRVDMHVDYRPGDHPIRFQVSSGRRKLHPWQAYAGYLLTGGYVLYGFCGEGFVVNRVFGPRQARPMLIDQAMFDPESAAQAGKWNLHLGYSCIRDR